MKLIPEYCESIQEQICEMEADVQALGLAIDIFEAEMSRKGLPRSLWIQRLPPEIEPLYDLHWELSSEIYRLDDGRRLDMALEVRNEKTTNHAK